MSIIGLDRNLALDKDTVEIVEKDLLPTIRHVRNDRRTLRETWLRYWRIWGAEPDQEAYKGRIQNYIPVARGILERWTQRIMQALFPSEEWFGVRALRQSLERRVPLVVALNKYYFEKHMRLRRHTRPFIRQLVTLGTSPAKVVWKIAERDQPTIRDIFDPEGNPIATEERIEKVLDYIGPTFRTVDLFGFYVWPVTCADIDEAEIAFEDLLIPQAALKRKSEEWLNPDDHDLGHTYENVEKVLENLRATDTKDRQDAERRRLSDKGFTHPLDTTLPNSAYPADITECVWRQDLDGTGEKRWLVVVGADDTVMRIQPVPWWHGRSPWLVGKFLEVENEFYGRSPLEAIDKLQYFINDIANQASDALVWSLNPISVIDMFRIHDPESLRMSPGAKWLGEPGAVEMKEPPKESAAMGFNALGQLISLVRDAAEPGPPSLGVGRQRSRSAQSAVQAQLNAAEAATPIRDVVESIEDHVFNPLLYMMHALSWQCLDRDLVLQIASTEGAPLAERKISVADIVGDFEFSWQGSTTALNSQVRANQMITYLGMASKIPPEVLQQEGIRIRLGYILKAIWSEGFQLPNASRVIEDLNRKTTIDPRIENDLFRLGRGEDVVVSEGDDDAEHEKVHRMALAYLPPEAIPLMQKHLLGHRAGQMAKHLMQVQQQAKQQGLMNAAKGANGGMPGMPNPGRPPTPGGIDDIFRSMPRGPGY